MWHLKTKMGVFWVVPLTESRNKYLLGINDSELAFYTDIDQAAKDVHDQTTGYLKWDIDSKVKAPEHITDWVEGEPQTWKQH
jgi:hypothetical protein